MTYSGLIQRELVKTFHNVLIPLLLDDLLWDLKDIAPELAERVLIPLLLDDLLWESKTTSSSNLTMS